MNSTNRLSPDEVLRQEMSVSTCQACFLGSSGASAHGWTDGKTVFKEKVKVKQKKPKKKLFGGKSKTTYYDKYGNYQPPQPDDRYYQNPGSGYGYDNRGQDYGYDSRYDSRSGRNYYEQPGGNPNYGYDNRGGRDYYGQPEGNPNYGYDNRSNNPNYGYDNRGG